MQDKTVKEVLDYIEKNSEFIFFYYNKAIDTKRNVCLSVKDKPITIILDQLFKGTDVRYEIKDRQISLKKGLEVRHPQDKKQQKRKLVGSVVDASTNEPLVGVSIQVKNASGLGTITDLEGKFSIDVSNNTELIFSYIGYKPQTLAVDVLGVLNVKMQSDNENLDEVVIVGAGTQKKVSVTGAISAVKGGELRVPSSSLTSNFAGKLAGVIASTNSGEPGSTSDFYIRGVGTFGGRATPLILLDDVEISTGDLNNLPAESIESFSILKDASATAIYGARGANGVMLITTKTGAENTKTRINVSVENSFQHSMNRVEYVDGARWMELYNEALLTRIPTATPRYSTEVIEYTRNGVSPYVYPNVDWYNLMFKNSNMNQRANINMQGGASRVTYYMGIQANHDTGQLKVPKSYSFDSNISRWNYVFQNNISYRPTSTTKIDLHLNAQFGSLSSPGDSTSSLFDAVYNANPVAFPAVFPAEEGDTHIRFGSAVLTGSKLRTNPYAKMMRTFSESHYSTINTSLKLNQQLDFITKGLNTTMLINMKAYSSSSYTNTLEPYYYGIIESSLDPADPTFYMNQRLQKGTDYISQGGIQRLSDKTFYFDARINYNRRFADHTISGMLMYMQREFRNDVLPNRNQGLSGRFTYDYQNKYFVEFNFGYNGTERLDSGMRFEFFPAMSLGYAISNEAFWESLANTINHLKVRGSYGLVGSDETGSSAGAAHFLYRNEVNVTGGGTFLTGVNQANAVSKQGPVVNRYAVENGCWERAKKMNIGLDMELFNQISLNIDFFHERRNRILQKRGSWPSIMGYASAIPWSNIGEVDNRGIELSLKWTRELIKDMHMELRGNFTYAKNKYIYKDEPDYPYVWQLETGKPLSATYGYIADGLFRDEEDIRNSASQKNLNSTVMPGDIKYRDINGDGIITDTDQIMLSRYGNIPQIQYGFGLNINYKHFDFGVFFNGSAKRSLMINDIAPFCSDESNQDRNLMKFIADDHWSEKNPNPNASYPRLGVTNSQIANNLVKSSFWLRNGNFLRFKTLEFGYSFPFCRVYISGDNLAVWSPFKLWDPELSWNAYPLQRTVNIGAQFNF